MSNDLYGYVKTQQPDMARERVEVAAQKANIGITLIDADQLFNFPAELLPAGSYVAFVLGDHPGKNTAEYLTEMVDYAPGALSGMPAEGESRLSILLDWVDDVVGAPDVECLFVAMCECSEIESRILVSAGEFRNQALVDFRQDAPPNRLYWVSK